MGDGPADLARSTAEGVGGLYRLGKSWKMTGDFLGTISEGTRTIIYSFRRNGLAGGT